MFGWLFGRPDVSPEQVRAAERRAKHLEKQAALTKRYVLAEGKARIAQAEIDSAWAMLPIADAQAASIRQATAAALPAARQSAASAGLQSVQSYARQLAARSS